MPASADNFAPALAAKLVTKYGIPAIIRKTTSAYNPLNGDTNSQTTTFSVTATPLIDADQVMKSADTIEVEDGISYVDGPQATNIGLIPARGMVLAISGLERVIEEVRVHTSGLQVAAYELRVKK